MAPQGFEQPTLTASRTVYGESLQPVALAFGTGCLGFP